MYLDRTDIIGRIGSDPEMRQAFDKDVANFSVAVTRKTTMPSGEKKEETKWIQMSAWDWRATFCTSYVKKGMVVYCSGTMNSEIYTNRDGEARLSHKMTIKEIQILDWNNKGQSNQSGSTGSTSAVDAPRPSGKITTQAKTDEIPF